MRLDRPNISVQGEVDPVQVGTLSEGPGKAVQVFAARDLVGSERPQMGGQKLDVEEQDSSGKQRSDPRDQRKL